LNAYAGISPDTAHEIEWLDHGVAVCDYLVRDGSRIVAENIPDAPDISPELIKSFGIKAYACYPLMERNLVLGTLSFGSRSRATFNVDDMAMMKTFSIQVAAAMARVSATETLRKSESDLSGLV
jgi:GAF domain-containing protein